MPNLLVDLLRAADRVGDFRAQQSRDAIEVLAEHPLNGRFAGWSRDCRQSFWRDDAWRLEPTAANVATLARLTDYLDRDLGVAMTAFENDLGSRVVVMGYFPWSQMHHLAKSSQMKAVAQWLSHDRLPVIVESFARVHLWVRRPAPGQLACVLLNGSLDPQPHLTLRLAEPFKQITWHPFDGEPARLKPAVARKTWQSLVKTPALKPWSVYLLTAKRD